MSANTVNIFSMEPSIYPLFGYGILGLFSHDHYSYIVCNRQDNYNTAVPYWNEMFEGFQPGDLPDLWAKVQAGLR